MPQDTTEMLNAPVTARASLRTRHRRTGAVKRADAIKPKLMRTGYVAFMGLRDVLG